MACKRTLTLRTAADISRYIMLSSYLSHVHLLPFSSGSTAQPITLPLPSLLGATCCTYVSPISVSTNIRLAAGGVDRAVHVFELPSLSPEAASGTEIFTLHGHTAPISSVCASSSGRELVSAGWDGQLNLYALPEEIPTEHQIPAEPTSYLPGQKKRRKMEKSGGMDGTSGKVIEGLTDGDVGEGGWRRMPDGVMRGHKGRVGGVVWDKDEAGRVWSAGWDGSIRGWEVESGAGAVVRVSRAIRIKPPESPELTTTSKDPWIRLCSVSTSSLATASSPLDLWTGRYRSGTLARVSGRGARVTMRRLPHNHICVLLPSRCHTLDSRLHLADSTQPHPSYPSRSPPPLLSPHCGATPPRPSPSPPPHTAGPSKFGTSDRRKPLCSRSPKLPRPPPRPRGRSRRMARCLASGSWLWTGTARCW